MDYCKSSTISIQVTIVLRNHMTKLPANLEPIKTMKTKNLANHAFRVTIVMNMVLNQ